MELESIRSRWPIHEFRSCNGHTDFVSSALSHKQQELSTANWIRMGSIQGWKDICAGSLCNHDASPHHKYSHGAQLQSAVRAADIRQFPNEQHHVGKSVCGCYRS